MYQTRLANAPPSNSAQPTIVADLNAALDRQHTGDFRSVLGELGIHGGIRLHEPKQNAR